MIGQVMRDAFASEKITKYVYAYAYALYENNWICFAVVKCVTWDSSFNFGIDSKKNEIKINNNSSSSRQRWFYFYDSW